MDNQPSAEWIAFHLAQGIDEIVLRLESLSELRTFATSQPVISRLCELEVGRNTVPKFIDDQVSLNEIGTAPSWHIIVGVNQFVFSSSERHSLKGVLQQQSESFIIPNHHFFPVRKGLDSNSVIESSFYRISSSDTRGSYLDTPGVKPTIVRSQMPIKGDVLSPVLSITPSEVIVNEYMNSDYNQQLPDPNHVDLESSETLVFDGRIIRHFHRFFAVREFISKTINENSIR